MPAGLGLRLRPDAQVGDGGRSLSGAGADRVLYLRPAAVDLVAGLPAPVLDPAARRLARTLLDAGIAEPWWPEPPAEGQDAGEITGGVTVVVPVHDRPEGLSRLLDALPPAVPVIVVDDASSDPVPVADLARRHGARLLVHAVNRGPAAARNTGLRAVRTAQVAFCDSDVVPEPGWLGRLTRHLEDPVVAAVAPRVLGLAGTPADRWVERYEQARSSLDLGPQAAQVRPRGPVSYVPSACLLARVAALGGGFDETMRAGEDVDLVWRLVGAGWRVRYEPAARVRHDHRTEVATWLRRKAFYGSSAAALARRHGPAVAPAVLSPFSAVVAVGLLAQRRWSLPVVAAAWVVATVGLSRRLRGDRRLQAAALLSGRGLVATATQTASCLTRHHWPLALAVSVVSARARRAWLVAAVVEGLYDRRRVGSDLPPVTYVLAHRLDDLAYGAGVWTGAARARSARALLPAMVGWRRSTSQRA